MLSPHTSFILSQINRFGALRIVQLDALCKGRVDRSSIYNSINTLWKQGLVTPFALPGWGIKGYKSTPTGCEYSPDISQNITKTPRDVDIHHTLACADAAISLYHHDWITGIATELELTPANLNGITFTRTPDALVRLRQGPHSFNLALEVEHSYRNKKRVEDVLLGYRLAFEAKLNLGAVIIVTGSPGIYALYSAAIKALPEDIRKKIMLFDSPRFTHEFERAIGVRNERVTTAVDYCWTSSTGEFAPIETKSGPLPPRRAPITPLRLTCTYHDKKVEEAPTNDPVANPEKAAVNEPQ
jgi:hypothetical protein